MNAITKKLVYITLIISSLAGAGCNDEIADEIKVLETSRLFSPASFSVMVVNQTGVRLDWRAVRNAESYSVEFYENSELDFSGTPARVINDISIEQLPLTVAGFNGETGYSVRVKAIGEGVDESLWVSSTFTTDAEQIFFAINPEEITATGVTLRWPAGEVATTIILNPGNIEHVVTEQEIAAGVAVISGLTSETEYTALLMRDDNIRGTASFTTLIDLGGAIIVNPEDDLKAIIEAATEGDVFALMPGDYVFLGNIYVNTSIGIIGAVPVDKPVITGVTLRMRGGAGIRLKDVIFDGTGAPDGNQTIVYEEVLAADLTYKEVSIENCIIRNYVKGVFYVNIAVLIESVTIQGTIYHNIQTAGGDFIDFRNGITKDFHFYNNTVYNSAADRDIFRMDAGGSTNFPTVTSIITIENNTFYNVVNVNTRRILYIRLASHEISVRKNIFAQTSANYSNQSATRVVEMTGNNYFNAPNLTNAEYAVHDTENYTTLDPGFTDPASGNFTVSNPDLILFGIGDPRWLP